MYASQLKQPKQKKQRTAAGDAAPGITKASGPLQCAICHRQFSRPSHHDRHYRTHLPPEGRLSLPCNHCGKAFGRNDVLLRHLRTAHGVDPGPQPKAAQKSCHRCVHLRRKCDRQQPCRLCAAGGAICQYPQADARTQPATTTQTQQTEIIMTAYTIPDPHGMASPDNQAHVAMCADAPPPLFQGSNNVDNSYNAHQVTFGAGLASLDAMDIATGAAANDSNGGPYLNGNGYDGSAVATNGCSPSFSDDLYITADTMPFVASLSAAGQLDFRTAGLDWLDFDVPDIFSTADSTGMSDMDPSVTSQQQQQAQQPQHPNQSQGPQYQPQQQLSNPPPPPPPLQQQEQAQPPHLHHSPTVTHSRQLSQLQVQQPHNIQRPMEHPPSAHQTNYPTNHPPSNNGNALGQHTRPTPTSVLPWPFDDTPDHLAPHRYSLPPLREILQNTLSQSTNPTPPNKSILASLVALMSDTRIPPAVEVAPIDAEETASSGYCQQPKPAGNNANNASVPTALSIANMDAGMAHAANLLKQLVDTYVAKFQPILPLLHVPTWDLASCPPVLISAMACVGSLLSDDEQVAGLTWSISDICMPMIAWLGSSDSANYRDIAYLSALCVHQIYSLGSGNRQLYQNADRTRGILVGGLRGMGCLTTRLSLEDKLEQEQNNTTRASVGNSTTTATHPSMPTLPADPATQHEQWMAWVRREREKRTAWSSFEYDCSLCTLTGRRGAVDLSELPSRLPCAETLWDAPSATAWAALRTRLHPDAQGAPVSLVLKAALSQNADDADDGMGDANDSHGEEDDSDDSIGDSCTYVETDRDTPRVLLRASAKTKTAPGSYGTTKASPQVSFWGKRLCAQVIGRLLWDLKQLETLSTSEYFGMPSLSTAHAANKVRLLRSLDNLLVSMDQPATVADLISYNIASLIGHYSHLYTAQDVLDIMLYIVRNTVAHGPRKLQHHKGIQMAKRRLVATLSRDPQEARRLVYHAAQIVAVANDYLVSAPCEILRLFMGYTFLIVFAAHCPSSHRFQMPPTQQATAQTRPGRTPFNSPLSSLPLSSSMPLPMPTPVASSLGGVTPSTVAAIQLDIPSHRIASTADVDNWIAHGGPAAIGSVPNLFADGGALAISRDAQAMLQRLKCWGLAEKFTKILQSFEATMLAGNHTGGSSHSHRDAQTQG
ncbi:uncharacterized protein SPSK_01400 [Sporothrix schenckii 1099-18]|uniref:Uncharacterized protein n=1 Tax=Sporothrix schenckii 1099-18 TaxID=1397361 RepID=A0A0F2MC27_SPOSC|nr:uncharacterized protein SPSK_01400 [Sporothrix schenckii 1099-18]KJR87258.1 hypothetical protein SPSK_01400 [Sporothrix schenckii 1099-18]